jgi:hypothetical protein
MLPTHIVLAVFAALVSQGNVVQALPQGQPQFNARSERIDGKNTRDVIDAANQPRSVEIAEGSALAARSQDNRLDVRTDAATIFGYVSGSISVAAAAVGGVRWAAKTEKLKNFREVSSFPISYVLTPIANSLLGKRGTMEDILRKTEGTCSASTK